MHAAASFLAQRRSYWVTPGRLLAGCYPGDKDADKAATKLQGMVDAGIRHVVNLMETNESNRHGKPFVPYKAQFSARGITCVRMPIRDFHGTWEGDGGSIADVAQVLMRDFGASN